MYLLLGFILAFFIPPKVAGLIFLIAALAAVAEIFFWRYITIPFSNRVELSEEAIFYDTAKTILTTLTHLIAGYTFGHIYFYG